MGMYKLIGKMLHKCRPCTFLALAGYFGCGSICCQNGQQCYPDAGINAYSDGKALGLCCDAGTGSPCVGQNGYSYECCQGGKQSASNPYPECGAQGNCCGPDSQWGFALSCD